MGNQFLPFINFFLHFMQPFSLAWHLISEISSMKTKSTMNSKQFAVNSIYYCILQTAPSPQNRL